MAVRREVHHAREGAWELEHPGLTAGGQRLTATAIRQRNEAPWIPPVTSRVMTGPGASARLRPEQVGQIGEYHIDDLV